MSRSTVRRLAFVVLLAAGAVSIPRPDPSPRAVRDDRSVDAPAAPPAAAIDPAVRERARAAQEASPAIVAGASDGPGRFVLRDRTVSAFFSPVGVSLSLVLPPARRPQDGPVGWGLRWGLDGARAVEPRPEDERPARVHSFVGDSSRWKTDQATYGRVAYDGPVPGVDLDIEPRRHGLKYSLRLAAGVDPGVLRFRFEGAQEIRVTDGGASLEVRTELGSIREDGLVCWQDGPAGRRAVAARYAVRGPDAYAIELDGVDPSLPLVVDPYISWFSFLGGSTPSAAAFSQASDEGKAIAVDGSGNVYVAGWTGAANFPVVGGFDSTFGGGLWDAFVAKINGAGPSVVWTTYLGGAGNDIADGIAVDGAGNVYVAGQTGSYNFPVPGGFQTSLRGLEDAFIAKINPTGTALVWSTYLGGTGSENGLSMAWDGTNVIVSGNTDSSDFPTPGAFDNTYGGAGDVFVTKISGAVPAILWSTYLGGFSQDLAGAVTADGAGNVYVTGLTSTTNFPTTNGFDTTMGGIADAFVTKINGSGVAATITWSTFLGGTSAAAGEFGYSIAVDGSGNVYVGGQTRSTDFPTPNGFTTTFQGDFGDCFVAKINGSLASPTLTWASYLGGSGTEIAYGIAVDAAGAVYVTGFTSSPNFPSTNGFDTTLGSYDGFLTKINGTAPTAAILWSTYLGGSNIDSAGALALDISQNVYLTGYTRSTDFNLTGAFDTSLGGMDDAFVTKINGSGASPVVTWSSFLGGSITPGNDYGYGVALDGFGDLYVAGYTINTDFPTLGALDPTMAGANDGFVSKLRASDGALQWSTYLGGASFDNCMAIAVDGAGNILVTGTTDSIDFPVPGGFDTTIAGTDVFVAKIAPTGASLVWATFVGGGSTETSGQIAVDGANNVYVTGATASADFPTTGGFDTTFGAGPFDAFITKIAAAGALAWSSYVGGSGDDRGSALAVTPAGIVYYTGWTASADLAPAGGFDLTLGGSQDAFLVKIDGSSVPAVRVWSSYLGGAASTEDGRAVTIDSNGGVIVGGLTWSNDFPTSGGFDTTNNGTGDVFLVRVNDLGATATLAWGTFLGGNNTDFCNGLAAGAGGDVYMVGTTYSDVFPVPNGFDAVRGGTNDAFVARINSGAASCSLLWSSLVGGSGEDYGQAIRTSGTDRVSVAGYTFSGDFPGPVGYDGAIAGTYDAFVVQINPDPLPHKGGGGGCGSTGLDLVWIALLLRRLRARGRADRR